MRHWYLFDYGMVISEAPEVRDWEKLQKLAGIPLADPKSRYWQFREDYDAGALDLHQYWAKVVERVVDDDLANELNRADIHAWSHLNPATETVIASLAQAGHGLALLSNMPEPLAVDLVDNSSWSQHFSELFISARLGLIKPDPNIYRHVLRVLGAQPEQVTFIDDRENNLAAAAALGMRTVLHTEGTDLAAELA